MSQIVEIIYLLAPVFGVGLGKLPSLSASAASAPGTVLETLIGMAGNICFWSGLMEIMAASGLADRLASVLKMPIRWIYGRLGNDRQAVSLLARNMAGNLLGLGSAATPSGLEGAARLRILHENGKIGRVPICLLAVVNTVSIQLIPSTVAAAREALGAAQPYDILLPVWCASVCSFLAALAIAKVLLGRMFMTDLLVPLIIAGILTYGARRKVDLYAVFAQGVKKGLDVLGSILPPMLLMTVGITMLQSTGAVDHLARLLGKPASMLGLPAPCIPLMVLRPFSGSGGLSLGISIMEQYGVESTVGRTAAVMLGAAETSFYTIGIYAAHIKGKDLKKIILAALAGDLAAFLSAAFFVQLLMK